MAKKTHGNNPPSPSFHWLTHNRLFGRFKKEEKIILFKAGFLCFALMVTWITFGEKGIMHYLEVKEELAATINRGETLQEANTDLKKQIAKIQNDPQYLEKVARQRYYMTRDNEVLFKFD